TAAASQAVYGPMVVAAQAAGNTAGQTYFAANAPGAVTAMGVAATELSNLVKNQILAKGAKYVTVVNLPDLASTPYALEQTADVRALIDTMVKTFNSTLATGLGTDARLLVVDAYTVNRDQVTNPGPYGLSNVKDRACDTKNAAKNPLGSSLGCTPANTIAGDVSTYLFADDVHPTPFGYKLLARYVAENMVVKGWL
ncbi:MAG TPA: SGNH/GDSL hydrolase family protein, partial [Burkholderiaceae bacterium]